MYDDTTLWKLVDGELPADDARALERAAADDPALARRLDELRALKRGVLGGAPEPSPGFAEHTVTRVRAEGGRLVRLETRLRRMTRLAVAASVAAVVSVGLLTIAPLRAQGPDASAPDSVRLRLEGFEQRFPDLTTGQKRQIRTILRRLDREKEGIRAQLDARRYRQVREAEEVARSAIRDVLDDGQRHEWDRIVGAK